MSMYTKKISEILYTLPEDVGVATEKYVYYKKVADSLVIITRTCKETPDTEFVSSIEKRLTLRPMLTREDVVRIFFEYPLIRAIGNYSRKFNSTHDTLTVFWNDDIIAVICTDE